MRAHIRIFLAFRICLNFYPILKIEPARPNLPQKTWGQVQGKKLSIFAIFCGSQPDTFCILSICDQKESSEPILPLWGHERPLTRLSKDTLTFDLGPTVWAHKAGAFSALKLYSGSGSVGLENKTLKARSNTNALFAIKKVKCVL